MKRLYRLLPAFILVFLLCSCAAVPIPDNMTFYDSGNVYEIDSKDFSDICSLIGQRIPPNLNWVASFLPEESITELKENGAMLEWSYHEPVDFLSRKGVEKMMMPLSGDHSDKLFYGKGKAYLSGPIAGLYDEQSLYKYLKDILE